MATKVSAPRGMRDFLPEEKAHRERVLGVIRDSYRCHGFDEIETPVMEDSTRLHAGLGGDNEKLAFGIIRRGLTLQQLHTARQIPELLDMGLRFDLTVPLARFYATNRARLPEVFRSIQIAPVWRAERPQRGRYRQFVQCDIDIIGESGVQAEAELVLATLATLDGLGLSGVSVRLNDRQILGAMLHGFGFPREEHETVLVSIDKLDKIGLAGVADELLVRSATPEAVAAFRSFAGAQGDALALSDIDSLRASLPTGINDGVLTKLVELGQAVSVTRPDSSLIFDPFLVRGMGYYTGPIFELSHPDVPYSLGGGGRYDQMIGRFLGTQVPAAGFSLGFERIVDLVSPTKSSEQAIALVHDTNVPLDNLLALQAAWVAKKRRVRLVKRAKNTKLQLTALADAGFSHFAFVDPTTLSVADLRLRPLD